MIKSDRHVHTVFSDGKNTLEEMVVSAIEKGLTTIGFSDHSYTFFDESYCVKKEEIALYKKTIALLKEKYKDKIEILCGVEQDLFSTEPTEGYDYVIGSVHYVCKDGLYLDVDASEEEFLKAVNEHFGGDVYAFCEAYYDLVAQLPVRHKIDCIGHFDLVSKFNEGEKLFSFSHPRYVAAWKKCADSILKYGIPFEINTGALSRKYRSDAYPSSEIRSYLKRRGATFVLASDSHDKANLCYRFEDFLP